MQSLLTLLFLVLFVEGNKDLQKSLVFETVQKLDDLPTSPNVHFHYPRHVHIAYGYSPTTEMVVTWSTQDNTTSLPFVQWWTTTSDIIGWTNGSTTRFVDQGPLHLVQYIHRVTIRGLLPGHFYMYHCGSENGVSDVHSFTAMQAGTEWGPVLAVYGDLGSVNAKSLDRLEAEVGAGMYDAILHLGDFAYDFDSDNGRVGDSFMDLIQPIAAHIPYMTCPGNHEEKDNFAHYKSRFTMPERRVNSMFYSFNMGPIHFISISTEFYYQVPAGIWDIITQYDWLVKDLKAATRPEVRAERPWIITYGHRPMYCSNNNGECANQENPLRVGLPLIHLFGLENVFMKFGVDLALWAHQHSYERMWPMYNHKVVKGGADPYHNPGAVVHVTTGSAGSGEGHDGFFPVMPAYTAFRSTDYGYSRLRVWNKTHLRMEQVSEDQGGRVIDSFTLVRDRHEAYDLAQSDPYVQKKLSVPFLNFS